MEVIYISELYNDMDYTGILIVSLFTLLLLFFFKSLKRFYVSFFSGKAPLKFEVLIAIPLVFCGLKIIKWKEYHNHYELVRTDDIGLVSGCIENFKTKTRNSTTTTFSVEDVGFRMNDSNDNLNYLNTLHIEGLKHSPENACLEIYYLNETKYNKIVKVVKLSGRSE